MIIVLDPPWIKDSFKWCVDVLIYWAKVFDISYEAINIYIFCIIWPLLTFLSLGYNFILYRRIKKSKRRND